MILHSDVYKILISDIESVILQSPIITDLEHAKRTLKWLLKLEPDADLAMQIAAFGHDIDRGVSKKTNAGLNNMNNYDVYRREHSERSAKNLIGIMNRYGIDQKIADRVYNLVIKHETGGDKDSDIIKDADSIAYFEYNIPVYLQRNGEEKTRFKIKYMYGRISAKAKTIISKIEFDDDSVNRLVKEEIGVI